MTRKRVAAVVNLALLISFIWIIVSPSAGHPATTTVTVDSPACSLSMAISPSSVTATVAGCRNGVYALTSWSTPSAVLPTSRPMTLFERVSGPPWTVALPRCFWKVDFSELSPDHHLLAARTGGQPCAATTRTAGTTCCAPALSFGYRVSESSARSNMQPGVAVRSTRTTRAGVRKPVVTYRYGVPRRCRSAVLALRS